MGYSHWIKNQIHEKQVFKNSTTLQHSNTFLKVFPLLGLGTLLCLQSCQKEHEKDIPGFNVKTMSGDISLDSNFVPSNAARLIAERLPNDFFQSHSVLTKETRAIENSFEIKFEDSDAPAMYVFNYSGAGGYAIISADYRYEPILAFVATGTLQQGDTLPEMMYEWMGYTTESINHVRIGDYYEEGHVSNSYSRWSSTINQMQLLSGFLEMEQWVPDPPDPCGDLTWEAKGPLMTTTWGQGNGYNNLVVSSLSCPGKPPVGCVATATAQILKYWSKPHYMHDYSLMSNNNGTNATQKLMSSLGAPVQLNMTYGCNGSGAPSSRVSPTLKNHYGYTSSGPVETYSGSKRWDIRDQIIANRVVYTDGYNNTSTSGWWIFKTRTYSEGHAWVIDGYNMNGNSCFRHFWYHMNWGWNGQDNGFFYENDWAPTGFNFQYNRHIIQNIYP